MPVLELFGFVRRASGGWASSIAATSGMASTSGTPRRALITLGADVWPYIAGGVPGGDLSHGCSAGERVKDRAISMTSAAMRAL